MKANIGISDKNLQAIVSILNVVLSDESVLYTKTRNYHWNYEGDNFIEMHKLFEEQYDALAEIVDEVAERIRMLGHYPEGRMKDFLRLTRLQEQDYTTVQTEQIKNLLADHESVIINIRKVVSKINDTYKDAGTADFLTGLMEKHQKIAWMLRSYLG